MRTLTLIMIIAAAGAMVGKTSTRRETITTNGTKSQTILHISKDDGDDPDYATWERNGVRFITFDAGVIAQLDEIVARKSNVESEHAGLRRQLEAVRREHEALGREQERIARQGNVEAAQRELLRKQRVLDQRQRDLEEQQRRLDQKQRDGERKTDDAIDALFERAVASGKAKRR